MFCPFNMFLLAHKVFRRKRFWRFGWAVYFPHFFEPKVVSSYFFLSLRIKQKRFLGIHCLAQILAGFTISSRRREALRFSRYFVRFVPELFFWHQDRKQTANFGPLDLALSLAKWGIVVMWLPQALQRWKSLIQSNRFHRTFKKNVRVPNQMVCIP